MKHNLVPIEISEGETDRVVDLLLYKIPYVLNKKIPVVLGNQNKIFICRGCLNFYTSENSLKIHKSKCENQKITIFRFSSEYHLHWKTHFHKSPLDFRIIADFEADNAIDNSSILKKKQFLFFCKIQSVKLII